MQEVQLKYRQFSCRERGFQVHCRHPGKLNRRSWILKSWLCHGYFKLQSSPRKAFATGCKQGKPNLGEDFV